VKKEEEKQITEKPIDPSRRAFIKGAGLAVGGAAIGTVSLVSACNTTTLTTTQTETKTSTLTQTTNVTAPPITTTVMPPTTTVTVAASTPKSAYVAWDATKCASCGRCQQICSTLHEGGTTPLLSSIKWFEAKWFDGWDGEVPTYPMFCSQCNAPDCYTSCPLKDKAMSIDTKTGARYVNKSNCIGCGFCVMSCPLSPPRIAVDPVQKKSIKCDLCRDRKHREVAKLTLTNRGSGYTSPPTVTITGGGGTGATAVAETGTPVASIRVTNGGSNYTTAPTVNLTGGGGAGATATATVVNGVITSITVTNGGSNYTWAPTVAFSGGGGTGAAAEAVRGAGPVVNLIVAWPGSGYTSDPTVAISGGGGSGATATATISTGQACIDVCARGALKLVKAEERI